MSLLRKKSGKQFHSQRPQKIKVLQNKPNQRREATIPLQGDEGRHSHSIYCSGPEQDRWRVKKGGTLQGEVGLICLHSSGLAKQMLGLFSGR
jgi:hypothetical protein